MNGKRWMGRAVVGGLAAIALTGCVTTRAYYSDEGPEAAPVEAVAVGDGSTAVFYDSLSPYGEWVVVPRFGRVWRPSVAVVGPGFVPYQSGGHWVYTELGWSWQSDWDWGWATFHYGRWMADPAYGWLWVPGNVWGPAWVDWRYGGGYVGWTPMAPVGVTVVYSGYRPAWCFVETRYLVAGDVYRYRLPPEHYHRAFAVTQVQREPVSSRGARWYAGPPPGHVASAVGRPIEPVRISAPPPGHVRAVQLPRAGATPPGGSRVDFDEPGTPRFARPPAGSAAQAGRPAPPPGTRGQQGTPYPRAQRAPGYESAPPAAARTPTWGGYGGGGRSAGMAPARSAPAGRAPRGSRR